MADNSNSLALLNRYERSVSREYDRALKALDRARAERKIQKEQNEPKPEPEETPESSICVNPRSSAAQLTENQKLQNEPELRTQNTLAATPKSDNPPLPRAA